MATLNYPNSDRVPLSPPVRSAASLIAIVAAIGSFILASRGREFLGIFCALLALGAGLIGGFRALSPRVSGGILSILAVVLGAIGLIFSIVSLAF
jgi:hypothetical protein